MEFNFKTKPYEHQQKGFDMLKDLESFAIFADMATGKTKLAIDIAAYKYCKGEIDAVLVIAPNLVHTQWLKEQFPLHCAVPYRQMLWQSNKVGGHAYSWALDNFLTPKMPAMKVFAVNVEAFQADTIVPFVATYVKHNKVFIIVDEATRIKNPNAKRSKTIHKLQKYGQRCILTGTPVTTNPFGIWSMFEFLQKNYFNCNFFIFQARYGVMIQGINPKSGGRYKALIDEKTWNMTKHTLDALKEARGGELMPDDITTVAQSYGLSEKNVEFIAKEVHFKKYKRLDELKDIISQVTFYAKKEDCLDLPEKIYTIMPIEMDKEHKKVYNNLKSQLLAEYDGKELTVTNKAALTTRLMQVCGGFFPYKEMEEQKIGSRLYEVEKVKSMLIGDKNAKLNAIKEDLEEVGQFPVIIWARFVAELNAIYDALKNDYRCCLYYGETYVSDRATIIDDFKAGKYDIFIGNQATAAFGLNLQLATMQYFYSNSFNVEERLQAEDRSHRPGVVRACVYKDVIYKGTIDEKIAKAITQGRNMNDFFKSQNIHELLSDIEEDDNE